MHIVLNARQFVSACLAYPRNRLVSPMVHRDESTAQAFSRAAFDYDAQWNNHPAVVRLRDRARARMAERWPLGSRVLELNCGTGEDAVALAMRGVHVVATDLAPDMVRMTNERIAAAQVGDLCTARVLAFAEISTLGAAAFDGVLSMMGGLNCAADLAPVARDLARIVRPGGAVFVSLMPRCAPWEVAGNLLRGDLRTALRRWRHGPVIAMVHGIRVPTYYYSLRHVRRAFGKDFDVLSSEGWNSISPPPASRRFRARHPQLSRWLERLEDRCGRMFPFDRIGDHIFIELRKRGRV